MTFVNGWRCADGELEFLTLYRGGYEGFYRVFGITIFNFSFEWRYDL
jgi:hypothetical protein